MDKKEERLQQIISQLKTNNVASIRSLSDLLSVSSMTIRRDLETLQERSVVKMIHGGAVYNPDNPEEENRVDYRLQMQTTIHQEEKIRIGTKAIQLLKREETFMLDSGTTSFYLAQALPYDVPYTIICWSLNILLEVLKRPLCKVIIGGGEFHPEAQTFESTYSVDMVRNTRASKAFVTSGGFHPQLGVTCPLPYELEIKKAAIGSSLTKILLLDSSKFGKICVSPLTNIETFDTVITDSKIPDEYRSYIESKQIKLIIV